MKNNITIKFLIITCSLLFSCNKENVHSKKMIKGDVWEVKDITVDGVGVGFFGEWQVVADESIYDAVPSANWIFESKDTQFEWQFQEKGKSFRLNYVQLCEECDGDQLSDLDYLTRDISGIYEVVKSNRKQMEFITSTAIGYDGKKVRISISRK